MDFMKKEESGREHMRVDVVLDDGAYMPERAYEFDAGFDLRTPRECFVPFGRSAVIDTGVHVKIPRGYVGMLKSKSGLNVNHGLVGEGVIDADYTGSIKVKLYNNGESAYTFDKGDKIIQLVILPIPYIYMAQVDGFNDKGKNVRGDNGFGSTGK